MNKYICIDIGGTSIKHGVITENGNGQTYGYALAMGYGSYNYFYVN